MIMKSSFINTRNFAGADYGDSMHYAGSLGYEEFGISVVFVVNLAVLDSLLFYGGLMVVVVVMGWVYSAVVGWTWGGGWLGDDSVADVSYIDDAGAGTIHLLSGTLFLTLTLFLSPQLGRFTDYVSDKYKVPAGTKPVSNSVYTWSGILWFTLSILAIPGICAGSISTIGTWFAIL
jgi:ammonia channel protein AmtB